jgi:hypothetical protein
MMPWPLPGARPAGGFPVRFFTDEVVFLRDRSDDGILGRSVFNVPPPIVGEWSHATFSNTASAREWFAALTLLPWVNKVEREFS